MPKEAAVRSVLSLKILASQVISKRRAEENDFAFFQDILLKHRCPKFNGYNTAMCREQGKLRQPKTKTALDMTPLHPDTMMTATAKAQEVMRNVGQEFVLFT